MRWTSLRTMRCVLLPAVVFVAILAGNSRRLQAQAEDTDDVNREYTIKAAYLYQFGRYVQWPAESFANAQSPLVIGVLGPDPFGAILDEIARTKRIDGRPIAIRRLDSMADYALCHILFVVPSVSPAQKAEAIRKAQESPILLVGDEPKFTEQGGTVNFFLEENKIRFEINGEAAKQDQLKISSKLLSLAKIVRR